MHGLRVMRVLLPAALLVLAIALLYEWRPRPTAHREPSPDATRERPRAEGVHIDWFKDGVRAVSGRLDLLEEQADGRVLVEGVRGLEVTRVDRGPLLIDAASGEGDVDPGASRWQFRREVVLRDPEEQLELRLPELEVDETAGEARAQGDIVFTGPAMGGRATRLVYGLRGQPTELWSPVLTSEADGTALSSGRALLLDGLDEIEWLDSVTVTRGDGLRLDASRIHLRRDDDGRPVDAVADGGVSGRWPFELGAAGRFRAEAVTAAWDDGTGRLSWLRFDGDVELTRGTALASARRIELRRAEGGPGPWRLEADGGVVAEGRVGLELGRLTASRLVAWLAEDRSLRAAEANDGVVFESDGTRAESQRALYEVRREGVTIELTDTAPRKARLARGRTRVAADRIRTDPAGTRLDAEGRVEATLLPGSTSASSALGGLFGTDDAVNFVSRSMASRDRGERVAFEGGVRAWQGERNLAAERIELDQRRRSLTADGHVSSRLPRTSEGPAVAAADYLQIVAQHLVYDDARARATYDVDVRLSVAEGWLESERLTIELDADSRRADSIESSGSVRLEWRTGEAGTPITGTADRVLYEPGRATIRLFGENSPAVVTRSDGNGGRTSGRVLTYHVDDGTLEVDSGERGTGTIRTGGGPR